jgi:uncharacterized protein DUF5916/cellulose/xylan binding protein with CBM9 domain
MKAIVLAVCLIFVSTGYAQTRAEFHISRASSPPKIDGDLHDDVWVDDPLVLGDWISYNPLYGTVVPQRTDVRIAYDDRNLYFAFHCLDSEPDKIRTTISRRDSVFNDDWVGFSLDSNGTGQTAYHLFVNPSGIQMDALNTSSSGERFEADMVWDSAGKLTEDGYTVEIKLPLQSIRFQSGRDVKMGILFWRRISRSGMSSAWPDIPPGQWVFNRHAHLVFSELTQPRLIELLPSLTQSINQLRAPGNSWNDATSTTDVGLSAKYGITSSITLDATINPDFSQVESDAFQVQVNQRFPIFFSEKRPFFMEGMGLFNIAGTGGDGNMITAMHTRKIINPAWGSKVTGTAGKVTFGVLSASDETPEDLGNRGASVAERSKFFNVGRVTYGLGESNYIGAMFTDTEHTGRHNRVAGGDLSIRFKKRQQFSATFLGSETAVGSGNADRATAEQVSYSFFDRKYGVSTQVEHYGKNFQMDTAFYNRTGFTSGWGYGELNFYPKNTNKSVLKKVNLFTWNKYGRDQVQDGNERFSIIAARLNFTRQGFIRIDRGWGQEPWAGKRFNTGRRFRAQGQVQIYRWLNINGNFTDGFAIYYDNVNPFQGRSLWTNVGFTLQPNQHINQGASYNRVRFRRASDDTIVYTVHIVNLRTTYQFNKHFLVRGIEQFDSSRRRVLIDLLASYEFVPGTVFHAGYGSLYEKKDSPDYPHEYLNTSRGLFLKASYLHRF